MPATLEDMRRFAASYTLFPPTTLARAFERLGFVQADPIRAPARAQDLVLRHRVEGYRAGDLDRAYEPLGIAEDFFVNYGFVTRELQSLMHPRPGVTVPAQGALPFPKERARRAMQLLRFVAARGEAHPRDVEAHFGHGTVKSYWGGTTNMTTQLLDAMHYRGLLRVVRRERGIRVYAAHANARVKNTAALRRARLDALVDVVVRIYAPVTARMLAFWARRLRYAVPQWQSEITPALARAKERLAHARVDGLEWYWPPEEHPSAHEAPERVRLLAPFDPVVQDRDRFELLWNWVYRFEAYTPVKKRKLGYYALPLLWRDRVIGWANVARGEDGALDATFGYVAGQPPRERAFRRELEAELDRMRAFLVDRVPSGS